MPSLCRTGAEGRKLPVLWYLSGLTCTHANVMDKGEYRRMAAELGLVIVCPDTSPRGEHVADEPASWQLGKGAGFYVDATEGPWAPHYSMYSYITPNCPGLVAANFPVDMTRQGIFGHSMGGHGALTIALKNPLHLPQPLGLRADRRTVRGRLVDRCAHRLSRPDKAKWRAP